jgi:hypothetical protein
VCACACACAAVGGVIYRGNRSTEVLGEDFPQCHFVKCFSVIICLMMKSISMFETTKDGSIRCAYLQPMRTESDSNPQSGARVMSNKMCRVTPHDTAS